MAATIPNQEAEAVKTVLKKKVKKFLSIDDICSAWGISRSTFYRERDIPGFPEGEPVSFGIRIGFEEGAVENWHHSRKAQKAGQPRRAGRSSRGEK